MVLLIFTADIHAQQETDAPPINKPSDAQRVQELQAELAQMRAEWEQMLAELNTRNNTLVQQVDALTQEQQTLMSVHDALQEHHATLEEEHATVVETAQEMADALDMTQQELAMASEARASAEQQSAQLDAELGDTRGELEMTRDLLRETENALTDARESNAALQRNLETLQAQLLAANQRIARHEAQERARNAVAFDVTGEVTRLTVNADREQVLTLEIEGDRQFNVGARVSIMRDDQGLLGTYRVTASQAGRIMAVCVDENLRPRVGDRVTLFSAQD